MIAASLFMISALLSSEANLLVNPGFEMARDGKPVEWSLYFMPQPGSEGKLDNEVYGEGNRSIMLRNVGDYANDPANNWSQNIEKKLAGKTLIVGGLIKTEDVSSADIWLQCWRKKPWGVITVARISDAYKISGDMDWTPVAMKVDVPEETNFITFRCVIKGKGTAWFDDLRVIDITSDVSVDKEVKEMTDALTKRKNKESAPPSPTPKPSEPNPAADANEPNPVTIVEKKEPENVVPKSADAKGNSKSSTGAESEPKVDVLKETQSLVDAVHDLRDTNEALRKELNQVREQLKDVRQGLEQTRDGAAKSVDEKVKPSAPAKAQIPKKEKTQKPPPPLVPSGYDWKELSDEK